MRVEWHGQSAFTLEGGKGTVFIDPFGKMTAARERGIEWNYPPIEADGIDLLLVTHEHADHNGVEEIALSLEPEWVVPMHYRTPRIGFLETEEEFAAAFSRVMRLETPSFDTDQLERAETGAVAVIPAVP
jgi:L-ascorbate metabolism protein UlaG (beta-lactamase superfamily)